MELTIEHLAPYLPYELEVEYFDAEKGSKPICRIEMLHLPDECTIIDSLYEWDINISEIKPLLIPLSELNKQWYDKIKEEYVIGLTDDDFSKLWKMFTVIMFNKTNAPYFFIQILLKYHFDVFGLIDAGLAINKNHTQS